MIPEYEVILSKDFKADLCKIKNYISKVLLDPEAADRIVDGIIGVAESFSFMPERCAVVEWSLRSKRPKRRVAYRN